MGNITLTRGARNEPLPPPPRLSPESRLEPQITTVAGVSFTAKHHLSRLASCAGTRNHLNARTSPVIIGFEHSVKKRRPVSGTAAEREQREEVNSGGALAKPKRLPG